MWRSLNSGPEILFAVSRRAFELAASDYTRLALSWGYKVFPCALSPETRDSPGEDASARGKHWKIAFRVLARMTRGVLARLEQSWMAEPGRQRPRTAARIYG